MRRGTGCGPVLTSPAWLPHGDAAAAPGAGCSTSCPGASGDSTMSVIGATDADEDLRIPATPEDLLKAALKP